MHKLHLILIISFLFSISIINVNLVVAAGESPLAPKAYLLRYWNKEIGNDLPQSSFLIEKASPLSAVDSAKYAKLASDDQISLSRDLHSFCKSANLLCFPDSSSSSLEKHDDRSISTDIEPLAVAPTRFRYTCTFTYQCSTNVNKRVQPGIFFRESMLKKGNVMPMPDIKDRMPIRSFLPRSIVSKLPFSSSKIDKLKIIFHAVGNSSMESILSNGVSECERASSPGETKSCAGSVEDMIDFATSVLGKNILVRTTENVAGSNKDIMIGSVKGINGGKVTKSVTCHQRLYPYLLYSCHSVPKVHAYEAEIMDPKTKTKINNGIAICHLDTSTWSPSHQAFSSLQSSPGKIEVCHWIFENDMAWTIADSK